MSLLKDKKDQQDKKYRCFYCGKGFDCECKLTIKDNHYYCNKCYNKLFKNNTKRIVVL